tara:strand:+ start:10202 stop:10624 length:423 start_codon:yes stop_codon:yes gene_type:complete
MVVNICKLPSKSIMDKTNSSIVWSSDNEQQSSKRYAIKAKSKANRVKSKKTPASKFPRDPGDGIIRIHRTSRGKGSGSSTLITGISGTNEIFNTILSDLKKQLGTGGHIESRMIIIQGNHREKVYNYFSKKGEKVKIAGS